VLEDDGMGEHDGFINRLTYNLDEIKKAIFVNDDVKKNAEEKRKYIYSLKEWLLEKTIKNQKIKNGLKRESVNRPRQRVYWIEFGINVGSEFSFPHFGVVIKEFDYTAIVVPISTEKEDDPEYKNVGNLFIPIGELEDLPYDKRLCYALVNQIRAVSKVRMSDYKDEKSVFHQITLDETQMKSILDAIKGIGEQPIKIKTNILKNTCNTN
jgi:mRNA-degrading endonuclease toxin of MazEF toxin-antitoxin module